jgi:hypothetical protein
VLHGRRAWVIVAGAAFFALCDAAHAQLRTAPVGPAYATVDEQNARIVVERITNAHAIEYRLNVLPKGGLRVNGALGIKVTAVSATGWRFDPPLPRTFYAGNEFFDDAPEIVIAATPARGVSEAVILLMYALCRDTACFSRDTTLAITQR